MTAMMKLTQEALCLLLKEVLDLPNEVDVVGLRALPDGDTVALELEGKALPEGATGVTVEYKKFKGQVLLTNGRRLLNRQFIRFVDAQDLTRHLASVDEHDTIVPATFGDLAKLGGPVKLDGPEGKG